MNFWIWIVKIYFSGVLFNVLLMIGGIIWIKVKNTLTMRTFNFTFKKVILYLALSWLIPILECLMFFKFKRYL